MLPSEMVLLVPLGSTGAEKRFEAAVDAAYRMLLNLYRSKLDYFDISLGCRAAPSSPVNRRTLYSETL